MTLPPAYHEAAGAIVALSVAVLAQLGFQILKWTRAASGASYTRAGRRAEDEPDPIRRELGLARLENRVLREYVAETRPEKAVELLLERFVPDPEHGFAALIEVTPCGTTCALSRGLCAESLASIGLSEAELAVVQDARLLTLEGRDVAASSVIAGLTATDALKATRLHLVALGEPHDPLGVFATTSLYPAGASAAAQAELVRRLMTGVAASFRADRALKEREAQLKLTSEMLSLRSLADRRFSNPITLAEAFLAALRPKVAADAAALFLFSKEIGTAGPAIARCGGPEAPLLAGCWRDYEERLARFAVAADRPRALGPAELPHYGIEALVRSVLMVPLAVNDSAPVGVICLTRGESKPFSADEQTLAAWSAEFLADAIPRVLTQAVVERQARRDSLTGLANRREWDQRYPGLVEETLRAGGEASLLLLDLDRFKTVNDTYGHRAGDEVLRFAARIVQDQVLRTRASDMALAARYGGEELVVLLPGFGTAGALRVAEAIRAAVERSVISAGGRALRTTISIGVANCPDHAGTPEQLFACADSALYQAKSRGRNRVCVAEGVPAERPEVVASE